jgi:hypothetical protein
VKVRLVAAYTPLCALGFAMWLLWAVIARIDRWSAAPFVALFYGLVIAAAGFVVSALWARQRGEAPISPAARELGLFMTAIALLAALWVWSPYLEPLVAWCVRKTSNLRFR